MSNLTKLSPVLSIPRPPVVCAGGKSVAATTQRESKGPRKSNGTPNLRMTKQWSQQLKNRFWHKEFVEQRLMS